MSKKKKNKWKPNDLSIAKKHRHVTIGNMSICSKPPVTDGERGRCREITVDSGAGEPVESSKGSVKGQRYTGPGGEKIDIWKN